MNSSQGAAIDRAAGGETRIGFSTLRNVDQNREDPPPFDRLTMHTEICSSCSQARDRLLIVGQAFVFLAFTFLALAAANSSTLLAILAIGSALGRLVVDRLERGFRISPPQVPH